MKIVSNIALGILCLSLANVCAAEAPKAEHYIFRYDTGDTYDVQLTENTITWTGLEGSDAGRTETDSIKRKNLSQEVEVIHWSETGGAFITLVFDRAHLRAVSSGKTLDNSWLAYGVVEQKNGD